MKKLIDKIARKRLEIISITALIILVAVPVSKKYLLIHNKSVSLNSKWFLIAKDQLPQKGEIFVFRVLNPNAYSPDENWLKIAGGVAGDEVIIKDRDFYINDQRIGTAKPTSLKNLSLEMSPAGVIPQDFYFAYTPHLDSYDSRYQEIGLIDEKNIIGTVIYSF